MIIIILVMRMENDCHGLLFAGSDSNSSTCSCSCMYMDMYPCKNNI